MNEKYTARLTKRFRKEYKKMIRQGKDITKLDDTIHKLLLGEPLPESQHDHPLTSNWTDHRECHIEPDWLLVYHVYENVLVLEHTRTGFAEFCYRYRKRYMRPDGLRGSSEKASSGM